MNIIWIENVIVVNCHNFGVNRVYFKPYFSAFLKALQTRKLCKKKFIILRLPTGILEKNRDVKMVNWEPFATKI